MGSPGLSNRNNGQQRLGITEPISLAGPTEYDVIKTRELEKVSVCTCCEFMLILELFFFYVLFLC